METEIRSESARDNVWVMTLCFSLNPSLSPDYSHDLIRLLSKPDAALAGWMAGWLIDWLTDGWMTDPASVPIFFFCVDGNDNGPNFCFIKCFSFSFFKKILHCFLLINEHIKVTTQSVKVI